MGGNDALLFLSVPFGQGLIDRQEATLASAWMLSSGFLTEVLHPSEKHFSPPRRQLPLSYGKKGYP